MKEILEKVLRTAGGKDFFILLVLVFAGYILLERTGVFGLEPSSFREIFFSIPSRILSIILIVNALCGIALLFTGEVRSRAGYVIFFISIIIIAAGLWVSIFTRFEGRTIRAEGQVFDSFPLNYLPQTLYMPDRTRIPNVSITVMEINPEPSSDMKKMERVTVNVIYAGKTLSGKTLKLKLNSQWPLISDWMFVRITDFGYAPKYVLYDLNEQELESHYIYKKLFPPGAEEHFEAMFLGYLFYIKCYPDYIDSDGEPWTLSAYPENPVYNLRIVRNKDIVFNGLLKSTEKVRFDNIIISIPEVKMWVEISIVRDPGIFVAGFGLMLLITGTGVLIVRKR